MNTEEDIESPREWIFTFGFGHDYPKGFVRIFGTHVSAREEMYRRFGRKWSMQYASEEEACEMEIAKLRELNAEMLTLLKLALPDIRLSELRMTIKNAIAKAEAMK